MSIYYTKHQLQDIEIKIHDARRRLESMLDLVKLGIIPSDDEVTKLHTDLVEGLAILSDYYIQYLNDFKAIDEIVLETKEEEIADTNVIPLFKDKKED